MDYIFDQNEIRTYNIVIPQTALDAMNGDPFAEEYHTAVQTPQPGDPKPSDCNTKGLAKCSRLFMGFLEFDDEYTAAVLKLRDEVYPQLTVELEKWRDQVRIATQNLNGSLGDPQPWTSNEGKKGARTEAEWSGALDLVESQLNDHMQELFQFVD